MDQHIIRAYRSSETCPQSEQLAWKLAVMAADPVPVDSDIAEMIENRVIDNAGVALASLTRKPVRTARMQALAHPRPGGARLFGLHVDVYIHAEWAAWANGTAVRELDFHDTYLAADYSHPGDNLPPLIAVAQQKNLSGAALLRGAAAAYETQIALTRGICLHEHRVDHIAHLGTSVAAGLGAMLDLPPGVIYQAIQQALHTTISTRQSRKGEISSWKAFAPAHAGKLGIEATDRAMRGEGAPSPIYEGEDSVIARVLSGFDHPYKILLPKAGEPKRSILESYTKAYSAEYQSQALIDLAFRMRNQISDFNAIDSIVIHTSHHTHNVIGTGSGDPQKIDPDASRETLDHSIMYIFAVALEDGRWHHIDSYTPERTHRPSTVRIWQSVSTKEDLTWTQHYHAKDPANRAFGGRVEITLRDGQVVGDEIIVANAHPAGAKPFIRRDYLAKFESLANPWVQDGASFGACLKAMQDIGNLPSGTLDQLNPVVPDGLIEDQPNGEGIF